MLSKLSKEPLIDTSPVSLYRVPSINMSKSDLEKALGDPAISGDLPIELPLAHLTAWRWLSSILDVGSIEPRQCKVFGKNLLYLSYGAVHYRTMKVQTESATELPVAIILSPEVLQVADCFYPFDSGAVSADKFGRKWSARLKPFADRFAVRPANVMQPGPRLVRALYGSNKNYVAGVPSPSSDSYPDPIPALFSFLNEDMSSQGIDHRHRSIEELIDQPVPLGKHLRWIGFPRIDDAEVLRKIYLLTKPEVRPYWSYSYNRNFNPVEIAAQLEMKARESIVDGYLEFPA
jgi:hypothetical protein